MPAITSAEIPKRTGRPGRLASSSPVSGKGRSGRGIEHAGTGDMQRNPRCRLQRHAQAQTGHGHATEYTGITLESHKVVKRFFFPLIAVSIYRVRRRDVAEGMRRDSASFFIKTTHLLTRRGNLLQVVYNVGCTCIKLYSCWFQFRLTVVPSSVVLFSFLRFQFLVSSALQACCLHSSQTFPKE